jgi:hypothetical protein
MPPPRPRIETTRPRRANACVIFERNGRGTPVERAMSWVRTKSPTAFVARCAMARIAYCVDLE